MWYTCIFYWSLQGSKWALTTRPVSIESTLSLFLLIQNFLAYKAQIHCSKYIYRHKIRGSNTYITYIHIHIEVHMDRKIFKICYKENSLMKWSAVSTNFRISLKFLPKIFSIAKWSKNIHYLAFSRVSTKDNQC